MNNGVKNHNLLRNAVLHENSGVISGVEKATNRCEKSMYDEIDCII